jgi:hypothetical protein
MQGVKDDASVGNALRGQLALVDADEDSVVDPDRVVKGRRVEAAGAAEGRGRRRGPPGRGGRWGGEGLWELGVWLEGRRGSPQGERPLDASHEGVEWGAGILLT